MAYELRQQNQSTYYCFKIIGLIQQALIAKITIQKFD